MTEDTGSVQGQEPVVSAPVESSQSAFDNNTQDKSEKLFKQQEVNEIVGRAKREAVERYERQKLATLSNTQSEPAKASLDEFRRIAAEESQRLMDKSREDAYRSAQEQDAQRIASEFFTKFNTGKEKYGDFEKVTGDLELKAIPHVVQLANMVENTADVMYELAKNPTKIAAIQQLIQLSPKLAYAEMSRLSQSIKDNEQAANTKLPNKPLSQITPSSNTGTDNGALSIRDLRSKYRG